MWRVWVSRRGCIGSWWGNRSERDHWGDLGVDGWIILGWISRRWDVGMWTGLGWPRIQTRWRTLVSVVMNLRVPWNAGNFLTSCKPVSFSRRTLHHGVSKYTYWTCIIVIVENERPTWCHLKFLFHFLFAQHVSDINISIIRSLRLFYCITTLVVCSCFGVYWCFGVAGLGLYPCSRLKHNFSLLHGYHPNPATPKLQHTSKQEHTTSVVIQ